MKKISCIRKIEFDAAHRVIGHENKCKYVHGHRYILEVAFSAPNLDKLGRVIDFGEVKNILKKWIDDNMDHTAIFSVQDKLLGDAIEKITNQKIYYINANPTAENIALHLVEEILPNLFQGEDIEIDHVKLHETPNCSVVVG